MRQSLLLSCLVFLPSLFAANPVPAQPFYIYLCTRIDDHINTEISAERLKRTIGAVEALQHKHPAAHVSLLVQFSGAMAQAMADDNAKSGLVDLVRKYQRSGLIETGYHGYNEPAYNAYPPVPADQMHDMSGPERWRLLEDRVASFLNDYRDPLTGKTDPSRPGGLREVQKVFGPISAISDATLEIGGDPEVVHQLRRSHDFDRVIMSGLPNPDWDRHLLFYRPKAQHFTALIAPQPNMAPEVFWQDDVLQTSEFNGDAVRLISATEGIDAMKKMLADLDRSHLHVIHVELSPENLYLTEEYSKKPLYPPVRYAYTHTSSPRLPEQALRPKADVEAAYRKQDDFLEFLAGDAFAANPGSHFLSSAALLKMASPAEFEAKWDAVKQAAGSILTGWVNNHPPDFAVAGDLYLSLADTYQMLVSTLAAKHKTGKFPDAVRVHQVYGPLRFSREYGNNLGTVTDAGLARACAELAAHLDSTEWSKLPDNAIPASIQVDGQKLFPAQLLRIMAQAITTPQPNYDIHVGMMIPAMAENHPITRLGPDSGTVWTLKPALLHPIP